MVRRRVARYMISSECPVCHGKRLRKEALSVKFAGLDIAELSRLPMARVAAIMKPTADGKPSGGKRAAATGDYEAWTPDA